MSRQFLVTKMVCARCGSNLNLTYEMPKPAGSHAPGEPTGADMVEQKVAIEPCDACLAPLRRLQEALESLPVKARGA